MISYVGSDIITCNDDAGVRAHFAQKYAAIPATATLPAVPESYWYSKELVAYIMAILSTVAYHKSGDPRITGVMDEAYAEALSLFRGMTAQAFNDYIVRRMALYLESWPVDVKPKPGAELHLRFSQKQYDNNGQQWTTIQTILTIRICLILLF